MPNIYAYFTIVLATITVGVSGCDARKRAARAKEPSSTDGSVICGAVQTRAMQLTVPLTRGRLCQLVQLADSVLRTAPDRVLSGATSAHVDSAALALFEFRDLEGRVTRSYWSIDFAVSGASTLLTVELPRDGRAPSVRRGHSRGRI